MSNQEYFMLVRGLRQEMLYLLVVIEIDLLVIDPCKNFEEARPTVEELFR
jgi:hypothetical protein